jgi:hypothetical protein
MGLQRIDVFAPMTRVEIYSSSADESQIDLGDQLDEEDIGEHDLWLFGQTLGIDTRVDKEFAWIAHEAFTSPVPHGWNVGFSCDGKAFYFNEETQETTWTHPTDRIYKETLEVIKTLRAEPVPTDPEHSPTSHKMIEAIDYHLQSMTQHAVALLDHWSGPHYEADGAAPYFYNMQSGRSTWRDPVADLESELHLQYSLLCRSLLPGISKEHITEAKRATGASLAMSQSPRNFHTPRSCADTPRHLQFEDISAELLPHQVASPQIISSLRCQPLESPSHSSIMTRRGPMMEALICGC